MKPCVVTIAGSDSGGGAGIQADIKTCGALGCYTATAITCLTAQNTQGVKGIFPASPAFVADQIDVLFEDFDVRAVKIGMLYNREIIACVAQKMEQWRPAHLVLDPVMYAEAGGVLIEQEALGLLISRLFPLATLLTPNLVEASRILKRPLEVMEQMEEAAHELLAFGSQGVLLKGGHLEKEKGSDFLALAGNKNTWLRKETLDTPHTHGTGCTYSSAIAAFLARGEEMESAVRQAKEFVQGALKGGMHLFLGKGSGPLDHFWRTPCKM